MYIKKVRKKNKSSEKVYEYLHLVENVRTEKGPRQRLILNLGNLNVVEDQYKELANCIESFLSGQQRLFSFNNEIERHAKKAARAIREKQQNEIHFAGEQQEEFQAVDVHSFEASELRSLGPEYVCHHTWKKLHFDRVLLQAGVSPQVLPILEALVVGRLIDPGSERHTWQWAENRSALYEMTGPALRRSLNSFYRGGDTLFSHKDVLEGYLSQKERDLFSLTEKMCFLDLTNTYLEGQASGNSKAKRGHSKEKRSDCKLLTLALVIDEQGFAKYSRLYPGNQAEGKTLREIIESMVAMRPELGKNRTVILDKGLATEDNIVYLKKEEFDYIVVSRKKYPYQPDDEMRIIRLDEKNGVKIEVKRYEQEGEVHLLCRSKQRIAKEEGIRTRQEKVFLERLEYYRAGLSRKGRTKKYAKLLEMVGRLREKYPGASKLYDVEVVLGTSSKETARDIIWKKRQQRYDEQQGQEGCYLLRTNRDDLSDKEIWGTYTMLTRVERAFRCLKSSLGIRPNYHQKEQRADAHMFISVLAYHLLHAIEHQLRRHGDHRSWETIRKVLSTHHRLTFSYNAKKDAKVQRHHLRMCSVPEPEHKKIYQELGLSVTPLNRKIMVA